MPKLKNTRKLQKKRAEIARFARTNYSLIDLNSSSENSSESSDDDLDNYGENSIIEQLLAASQMSFEKKKRPAVYIGNSKRTRQRKNKAFREAAKGSLKLSHYFNNTQLSAANNNENTENLQDQENQVQELNERLWNDELRDKLSEELGEELSEE
ncbi:3871_t:CDS:2 [Scutellospora calospora]|uniref:3871_t:CDS:1 n=1 Tax=Scutellospora calospora TaxID=85575 RepID=A0ACA9L808_9GLOM|nr:3871_t:CDS:2 [Scutellospora calospora]